MIMKLYGALSGSLAKYAMAGGGARVVLRPLGLRRQLVGRRRARWSAWLFQRGAGMRKSRPSSIQRMRSSRSMVRRTLPASSRTVALVNS